MRFQCDTTARVPIYRQLVDQVRAAVARGRVRPGDRLPSVRQLSRELVVNPNTVARAYTELQREGVLNTRPGLGVFIAEPQAELSNKVRRERLRAALDLCLTEAVHLDFTADEVTAALAKQIGQFQFAKPRDAPRGAPAGSNPPPSNPRGAPTIITTPPIEHSTTNRLPCGQANCAAETALPPLLSRLDLATLP